MLNYCVPPCSLGHKCGDVKLPKQIVFLYLSYRNPNISEKEYCDTLPAKGYIFWKWSSSLLQYTYLNQYWYPPWQLWNALKPKRAGLVQNFFKLREALKKPLTLWACSYFPQTPPSTVSALVFFATIFGLLGLFGTLWNRFCNISGKFWSKKFKRRMVKILQNKGERVDFNGQLNQKIYEILS